MAEKNKLNVAQEISNLDKTERAGKILAVSLPLAYVSGYLIFTSNLGTYGLHLNASELFRAKYIYVGFQYLMFLVLMFAVFSAIFRVLELCHMLNRETNMLAEADYIEEKERALNALNCRTSNLPSLNRRKFHELRGDFVVGLIAIVLTMEVIFVNPEKLGGILPFQILYLSGVAIYQFTFCRELQEPFSWGLVRGHRYVEDIRWLLLFAQVFAAFSLFLRVVANIYTNDSLWIRICAWFCAVLVLEIEVLSLISICASTKRLTTIDSDHRFNPTIMMAQDDVREEILKSMWTCRALRGAWCGYFMPCRSNHPLWFRIRRAFYLGLALVVVVACLTRYFFSHPPFFINVLLVGAPLVLTLLVFSNVFLMAVLFSRRSHRLGFSEQVAMEKWMSEGEARREIQKEKWKRYIRRAVMATVLYLTSVLSFGYVIYPHIPVQKSGGNYETANMVCVIPMKETPFQQCPNILLPNLALNEAYVAIEEDPDYVYLANDHDTHDQTGNDLKDNLGGPHCWSWANVDNVYCRPRVYAVSRRCIAGIVDALPEHRTNQSEPRCPTDGYRISANTPEASPSVELKSTITPQSVKLTDQAKSPSLAAVSSPQVIKPVPHRSRKNKFAARVGQPAIQ